MIFRWVQHFILFLGLLSSSAFAQSEPQQSISLSQENLFTDSQVIDPELLREFENLSEKEQAEFLQNRKFIINGLEKALKYSRLALGTGSVVKGEIRFTLSKVPEMLEEAAFTRMPYARPPEQETKFRSKPEVEPDKPKARPSIGERGSEIIKSILSVIDTKLWSQAPVVANANEFGLLASVGFQLMGGTNRFKFGGIYSFGISLGYNKELKALVFQIYRELEPFHETPLKALLITALYGKVGISVDSVKTAKHAMNRKTGQSFYPPVIYMSASPEHLVLGASTGIGLPPPPWSDVMIYNTKLDHQTLLRISVSPLTKGFLRMHIAIPKELSKWLYEPIKKLLNMKQKSLSCSKLILSV